MGSAEQLVGMKDDIRADLDNEDTDPYLKNYLSGVLSTIETLELGMETAEKEKGFADEREAAAKVEAEGGFGPSVGLAEDPNAPKRTQEDTSQTSGEQPVKASSSKQKAS
jgi:hypothetical protein